MVLIFIRTVENYDLLIQVVKDNFVRCDDSIASYEKMFLYFRGIYSIYNMNTAVYRGLHDDYTGFKYLSTATPLPSAK